jgi:hypothetical protein
LRRPAADQPDELAALHFDLLVARAAALSRAFD